MSHFAQVIDGKVTNVIVAEQDFINQLPDKEKWIQTSYNTVANKHLLNNGALRGNFASIGYIYDKENDVFYPPKPSEDAILDTATWSWKVGEIPVTIL